jgi:hypothetical protein
MRLMILFLVEHDNIHVLTYASDREAAKRKAFNWLGWWLVGDPDQDHCMVTPLTEPGDRIHLDITVGC